MGRASGSRQWTIDDCFKTFELLVTEAVLKLCLLLSATADPACIVHVLLLKLVKNGLNRIGHSKFDAADSGIASHVAGLWPIARSVQVSDSFGQ
ncbi:hypothetical protein LIA77_00982 [Sarocladium implicatum]|nr:hypothetical protein LIA77_00982 [Sarocladium implicatum]